MPTVSIPDKDIQFYYTDSGPPDSGRVDYTTFIFVHGHTFHAGIFQKLLPLAAARSLRIICINRREYPGSTPHTPEELRVYTSGSAEERTELVKEAGINLALAVDGIIQECKLTSAGSAALVGWSLGITFILAAMAAILNVPSETRQRLQSVVRTFILWDPPVQSLGAPIPPNAFIPLHDPKLAPAARVPAFARWTGSYFTNGDLSTRDPLQLSFHANSQKGTFDNMPDDEFFTLVDLTAGDKCDTILTQAPFASTLSALTDKTLFDPETRTAWNNPRVVHLYGGAGSGFLQAGVWHVQGRLEALAAKDRVPIVFRCMDGANHFVMWDTPDVALDEFLACT